MTPTPTPTAVEALRLATEAVMEHQQIAWAIPRGCMKPDEPLCHAVPVEKLQALRQALQLHGGGGDGGLEPVSQSSLRSSVPPDQVPEAKWLRAGNLLYMLVQDGWRKGAPVMVNSFMIHVSWDWKHVADADGQALVERIQQALSGGGEAKPMSETDNPTSAKNARVDPSTLQGPTREGVVRIVEDAINAIGDQDAEHHVRAASTKAADEILALMPTSPWRDIADAPRDGTHVLLNEGGAFEGRWIEDGGWWAVNNDPTDYWGEERFPTQWMPLPSPGGEG